MREQATKKHSSMASPPGPGSIEHSVTKTSDCWKRQPAYRSTLNGMEEDGRDAGGVWMVAAEKCLLG